MPYTFIYKALTLRLRRLRLKLSIAITYILVTSIRLALWSIIVTPGGYGSLSITRLIKESLLVTREIPYTISLN
jgi:hypothetical protein